VVVIVSHVVVSVTRSGAMQKPKLCWRSVC
jgi:hypothetical protein